MAVARQRRPGSNDSTLTRVVTLTGSTLLERSTLTTVCGVAARDELTISRSAIASMRTLGGRSAEVFFRQRMTNASKARGSPGHTSLGFSGSVCKMRA